MNRSRNRSLSHRLLLLASVLGTLGLMPGPAADAASPPVSLQAEMANIARVTRGPVGAAVVVVEGGGRIVALHGEQRFPMQSVYRDKYPNGTEMTVSGLLGAMIGVSDGTASDILLKLAGGPERVTGYVRGLGVRDIVVATTERAMAQGEQVQYWNWATPDAMAGLLCALLEGKGLSASSRRGLLGLMTAGKTGADRIRGLLPTGTIVAHKTGFSGTVNGLTRATRI